jgi:hypothetical protein
LVKYGWFEWGALTRIATELGVSRSVICRDRQELLATGLYQTCPHCSGQVSAATVQVVDLSGEPVRTVRKGSVVEHQAAEPTREQPADPQPADSGPDAAREELLRAIDSIAEETWRPR